MQNIYKKKSIITLMILAIALTIILSSVFFILSGNNNAAEAIEAANIPTQSTNLGEMLLSGYDTKGTDQIFDTTVFWGMISQITGVPSPNAKLISTMTTPKTSADFRALNGGNDVVVTIGGKQWIATYLSTNLSGKPILTFWLANNATTSTWGYCIDTSDRNYYNSWQNQYTSNLYGTSFIRTTTLNNGGWMAKVNTSLKPSNSYENVTKSASNEWAIYTMDKKTAGVLGKSLVEFIEVPNNMDWQLNQDAQDKVTYPSSDYNFNNNNDAISAGGNSTTTGDYLTKLGTSLASYYKAWGADTLWLPSVAETGITGAEGIWMATDSTRANSTYSWLRSAYYNGCHSAYVLAPAGSSLTNGTVNNAYAVRPAFHLNLELAAARAGLLTAESPTDVTVEYNGKSQTISDVPDAQKGWYDPTIMTLSHTVMTSAGDYTVTAEILSNLAADGLEFKGTPDTSDPDPNKQETATKRFFTFTITKKPLTVTWTNNADGVPIPSLDSSEICGIDVVNLNIKYEGTLTTSGAAYSSTSPPKNAGTYTATIESLSNPNYDFATGTVMSKDFTLDIRKLNLPTITATKWLAYNGKTQTYFVDATSYDPDYIEITRPSVFTDNDYKFVSNTITVKDVNAKDADNYYYLTVSLKDKDNTVWAGSEDTADKQLKFKILPYEVVIELNDDVATLIATFSEDTDMYIEVTDDGILEGHTLTFDITASFNGVSYPLLSGLALDENSTRLLKTLTTSNLPAPNISYAMSFALRNGEADNDNFHITCNSVTIKVEEEGSGRDTWRITKSTGGYFGSRFYANLGTLSVAYTDTITYDGTTYGIEFKPGTEGQSVDTTYNTDGYINGYKTLATLSTNSDIGKNADTYTTFVRVIDSNNGNAIVTYQITWTVSPYVFDLSKVTWKNNGVYEYTGSLITPSLDGLPSELKLSLFGAHTSGTAVQTYGSVTASFSINTGYVDTNYVLPDENDDGTYGGPFTWSIDWEITPLQIKLTWDYVDETDSNGVPYQVLQLKDTTLIGIVDYEYYLTDASGNIIDANPYTLNDIVVSATSTQYFKTLPVITMGNEANYKFPAGSIYSPVYSIGGGTTEITISLTTDKYTYTGKDVSLKWASGTPTASLNFKFYEGDAFGNAINYTPKEVGTYWVEVTSKNSAVAIAGGSARFQFWITKSIIDTQWNTAAKPPVLANLKSIQLTQGIEYEYYDANNHKITFSDLSAGGTFYIRAIIKDTKNFEFDDGNVETVLVPFTIAAGEALRDPSDINNPNYDFDDEDDDDDDESGEGGGGTTQDPAGPGNNSGNQDEVEIATIDFGAFGRFITRYWQPLVIGICTILIIIFLGKTAGYESKRKKYKKKADKLESSMFAAAAPAPLWGLAYNSWTALAIVAIALAVASLVIMIIAKYRCNKAQEEYEEVLDEYQHKQEDKKEEKLRMMFMGMNGGSMGQGMSQGMPQGFAYTQQPAFGMDEMRGMITETVSALLPGVQQLLPAQAGTNDALIQKLIDQNEKLMEKSQKNETEMRQLLKEISKQNSERVVEVSSSVNEETIQKLIDKNDERIEKMMKSQEALINKILERDNTPQVIEKEVVKEVPVEVVKEVPVEVVKEVPVEKIVEKEVPVEVIKEVKVEVPVKAEPKPKREATPRLTLDEAYKLLTKEQKKFFDGLKQYVLDKYKCKEKKTTYFVTYGQTATNPLLKLMIKKNITVAMLKMEDELMKDIRRDATGDGTKVKVKETEILVTDAQAFDTAKKMIDLRYDQIERYADLLKEQRSLRRG